MDISDLSIVDYARGFSIQTWWKLGMVHSTKAFRLNETTITQDLVFAFFLLAKSRKFPVKIFESTSEKTNGNDLEILIQLSDGVIKLPCQAKVIGRTGRYSRLNHKVQKTLQIDLLLDYAKKIGGYPLYLFYNHYYRGNINKLEEIIGEDEGLQGLWGCTIGSADIIKSSFFKNEYRSPHFYDLHNGICRPFFELFEAALSGDGSTKLREVFQDININKLTRYPLEEILTDSAFVDLTPRAHLGFIPPEVEMPYLNIDKQTVNQTFKPRFRILLSKENLNVTKLVYLD